MIPAVSYLRMSKDSQDTSIAAQRSAVATLAKSGGYKIIREYVDSGISGDATEKRLEFQRMMVDVAKADFKAVLCWDQDRFGRFDPLEAGFWIKPMRDAGVVLVTVAQGKIDWTEFAGRILYTIQQEGKHQFLRDLSRNVNRGRMAAATEGRWCSGRPPYGYKVGENARLVIDEPKAAIVREIFRLYLAGNSFITIRGVLNKKGVPSPSGKAWATPSISKMLKNPAYIGHTSYNRISQGRYTSIANGIVVPKTNAKSVINDPSLWITVENTHPPLVSVEDFKKAAAARLEHSKWTGSDRCKSLMFKTLLSCGYCGYAMYGNWVPVVNDFTYYCCHNWASGECVSNRTYQLPLLEAVGDAIESTYLSDNAIAAARALVRSRQPANSSATPTELRRQAVSLRAKLTKAEKRLMEVEPDMVAVAASHIRELRQQLAGCETALSLAERPQGDVQRARLRELEVALDGYRRLVTSIKSGPSEELMFLLRETISKIRVTSIKEARHGQPKGRYRISQIEIQPKTPDQPRC